RVLGCELIARGFVCNGSIRSNGRCELCRGSALQRAVESHFVIVAPPFGNLRLRLLERDEPMLVEAFVAEPTVEAFDVRVLRRLARLDQHQLDPVGMGPLVERTPRELRPLVGANDGGIAAETARGVEQVCDALS